jgi:hypothetical protein
VTTARLIGCPAGCAPGFHECGVGLPIDDHAEYDPHTAFVVGYGCDHSDPACIGREGWVQ